MNISKTQLNILLDALCSIANGYCCGMEASIKIVEEVFHALDRGDGSNDFTFQCKSCRVWKNRIEEICKCGYCSKCYEETLKDVDDVCIAE